MLKANDKYNAKLSSGYTVGQNILNVTAVPDNVPTQIVAAKGTDNETVFSVTGKTTSTLTGVTRVKGANVDLDAQTPLTCLNNEEFINQFHEAATAKATGAEIDTGTEDAKIVTPKAIADSYLAGLWDGWIPDPDTWVYVSATSFKIEGKDVTARFPKGTKIKLTQTSAKYFYVINSAFSTDTTITVTGGSDYTLANAAITSPYYSYVSTPQGFPNAFNWVPTYTNLTVGSGTVIARFSINGVIVSFRYVLTFAANTSLTSVVTATLPVPAASEFSTIGGWIGIGTLTSGGAAYMGGPRLTTTSDTVFSFGYILETGTYLNQGGISSTVPFTWTTNNQIAMAGSYEMD